LYSSFSLLSLICLYGNPTFRKYGNPSFWPVFYDLEDFADKGILAFRRTWPKFIPPETELLAFFCSGEALCENRAIIEVLEFARFNSQRCETGMVEKEEAGYKVLEVDLVPDEPEIAVFEK
jgi:hypothetical protein